MGTVSHYDRTCDSTEEWMFLNHHKELLKRPDPNWHFDPDELRSIAVIYYKLQRDAKCDLKQELPNKHFSNVLHKTFGMADDAMMSRIFVALESFCSTVSLKTWISALSIFLRGSLKQKIKFCFKVYDISGKKEITREQMINLMRKFVYKHQEEDAEEDIKGLVAIIIDKMDQDKNGIISFDDYSTTVLKDPMLLECFGQCLPDRMHVYAFLITFTDKIKNF